MALPAPTSAGDKSLETKQAANILVRCGGWTRGSGKTSLGESPVHVPAFRKPSTPSLNTAPVQKAILVAKTGGIVAAAGSNVSYPTKQQPVHHTRINGKRRQHNKGAAATQKGASGDAAKMTKQPGCFQPVKAFLRACACAIVPLMWAEKRACCCCMSSAPNPSQRRKLLACIEACGYRVDPEQLLGTSRHISTALEIVM